MNFNENEFVENIVEFIKNTPEFVAKNSDELCESTSEAFQLIKLMKFFSDIPSKLFLNKLTKFLQGVSEIPIEKREAFLCKFNVEFINEGNRLLELIDKIDDDKKVQYLVQLFRSLVEKKIDLPMFFRLTMVIKESAADDLFILMKCCNVKEGEQTSFDELTSISFVNSGIIERILIERGIKNGEVTLTTFSTYKKHQFTKLAESFFRYAKCSDD